jgi:murein DD-endopeptidase MepM/ murein hydrolase activator NlpD
MNTVPMQLPFPPMEWWNVGVGWDTGTHTGAAKYCWDFNKAEGPSAGAPLHAAAAGAVVQIEPDHPNDHGAWIYVEHAPGENFVYLHIQRGSWNVAVGDKVQMGQRIAAVGDTGAPPGSYRP